MVGASVAIGGSFSIGGAGSVFYLDQSLRNGFSGIDVSGFPATSLSATSIVVGDLDKNGTLDAVIGTSGTGGAKIYLNNGNGTFSALSASLFTGDAVNVSGLALTDLNNDGWLDLVVAANGAVSKLYVNGQAVTRSGTNGVASGSTTFATATGAFVAADAGRTITIGGTAYVIQTVTDGTHVVVDKVVAAGASLAWQLVAWQGFGAGTAIGASGATTAVATGDVTDDGLNDVVLATGTTASIYANLGFDPGTHAWLGLAAASALPQTLAGAPTALAISDLNGDGLADIVVATAAGTKLYLAQGTVRSGADGASTAASTTFTSASAAFTQADKGRTIKIGATFFTVASVTNATTVVLNATVSPTAVTAQAWTLTQFDNGTAVDTGAATSLAVGDLNGDTLSDLVVGTATGASLYVNRGADGSGVWQPFAAGTSLSTASVKSIAIGDVDGDGSPDIVLGVSGAQNQVVANRGGAGAAWGGMKAAIGFGSAASVTGIALGNVDTDHDLDLIAVAGGAAPSLYRAAQVTVTRLAATGVTASFTTGGLNLTNGQGAFVLSTDGIAGNFSGDVAAGSGTSFNVGVSVAARLNTTTHAIDETIVVNGTTLTIGFSGTEIAIDATHPFVELSGSGSIRIGNFVELEGSFTASQTSASGTANVFIGQGPSHLTNGAINPSARGIYITNAHFAFSQASGKYVLYATGTVSLIGIPGVTLSGDITVQFNNTGASGPLTVPTVGSVTVLDNARSAEGTNVTLSLGGIDLGGDISFDNPGDGSVSVAFSGVHVNLGNGAVAVTALAGSFSLSSAGVVGSASGTLNVGVPGFPLNVSATLKINTTAVAASSIDPHTLKVEATTTLAFAGQSLGGTFGFEQVTGQVSPSAPPGTAAPKLIRVGVTNGHLTIGAAGAGLTVSNGTGFFLITPGGIAGSLAADVDFSAIPGGGVTFGGSFALAINTTTVAVAEQFQIGGQSLSINVPAGPYLRLEGTGVHLTILGQTLTGDFVFEQAVDSGAAVTRILAQNVSASLGDASNAYVTLTDGSGFFVVRGGANGGLAGRIAGNVAISVPGVLVSGSFTLAFSNITTAAVNAQIAFGDQPAGSTTVAVGDVNGDLKPDLVIGTAADGIFLYLNDGSPSAFDTLPAIHIDTTATTGDQVKGVALGDLDGNGSLDLVVAAATNRIYLNDGHGVFKLDTHSIGANGTAVALGDVNGDGRADIAIGHNGSVGVQLYLSGGLTSTTTLGVTTTTWDGPGAATALGDTTSNTTSLVFADVNKDTHPDLVVGNYGQVNHLYVNTGSALGAATAIGSETDNTVAIAVGDVNGDGYVDVVAVNAGQSKAYLNQTVGTSVQWASAVNVGSSLADATSGVLVDVNGDGNLDLVVGVAGASGGANKIFLNNGTTLRASGNGGTTAASDQFRFPTGTFTSADFGLPIEIVGIRYRIVGPITAGSAPADAGFSFVTLDRAVVPTQTNTVWKIYQWNGVGSATTAFAGDTTKTQALAVADLNGDGKSDLVVINSAASDLNGVYFGDGSTFASPTGIAIVAFSVGQGPFLRVEGTNVNLSLLGQTLHGDIQFQQQGTGSSRTTSITISSGATLQIADLPALSVNGSLLVTAAGVAGRFHLSTSAPFVIGPVTLTGSLDLLVNTTNAAVTLADTTRLDAGPFLRIDGTNISVTLGDATLLGNVSIEQSTNNLGQRRLAIGVTGATVSVGSTQLLSNGQGALLILTDGIAGQLSGTVTTAGLLPPSISISGTFGIAINRTGHAIDETLAVAGQSVTLDLPAGPYTRLFGTGVQVSILGQTLSGDFAIEKTSTTTTLTASNVSLRIGSATADFVTITNGHGVLTVNSAATGISGSIAGTVAVNIPGISLTGTLQVEIDTTVGSPFLKVHGTGVSLTVLGQTLSGDFSFAQTGTGATRTVTLAAQHVALSLGTVSAGLTLSEGGGNLTITSAGVSGTISGNVTATLPGFAASFAVDVQLNTTTAAAGTIPANSFRVSANNLTLTLFGSQTLTGNFAFEQVKDAGPDHQLNTGDDTSVIKIAASNVHAFIGSGTTGITISNGTALILVTGGGVAGTVSAGAAIDLGNSISASATLVSVSFNNTALAVTEQFVVGGATQTLALPAGPYLKVAVTGLSLTIAGQTLTGDLSFTKTPTLTTVDFANVGLRLGNATHDFVLVSAGSGHFDILSGGIHGTLTATIAVDVPNVTVGGTFSLTIDTTTATPSLSVTVTNGYVSVLGQKLAVASLTFSKVAGVVSITVHNATLALGNGTSTFLLVTLTDGSLTLQSKGIVASLTGTVTAPAFSSSDFSLSATVGLAIDTTSSTPYLRVQVGTSALPVDITILGQQLRGAFTFEQLTTAAGAKVVRIGLSSVHLFIGAPGGYGVTVDNGSGSILITPVGIAGTITATPTVNLPGFAISGQLNVEFNKLTAAFHQTFTYVDGATPVTTTIDLQAGPYVRVAAYSVDLTIAGFSAIHGDFFFEQATRTLSGGGTEQVTKIGAANITFAGIAGAIQNARGALVVLSTGVAGVVLGTASASGSGFAIGATLGLGVNSTTTPTVHESVTVNGVVIPIDLDSTGVTFLVQNADFNFLNLLEIHGNFQIQSNGSFKATGLSIFVGKGPYTVNGNPNPDAIGLLITNAAVSFQRAGADNSAGTYTLYAKGTIALVGLDGLQVSGTVELKINTTETTKTIADPTVTTGATLSIPGNAFDVTGTSPFAVPGVLDIGGTIHVTREPTGVLDISEHRCHRLGHRGLWDQRRRGLPDRRRGRLPPLEFQGERVHDLRPVADVRVQLGADPCADRLARARRQLAWPDERPERDQPGQHRRARGQRHRPERAQRAEHAPLRRRRLQRPERVGHEGQHDSRRDARVRVPRQRRIRRRRRDQRRADQGRRHREHLPLHVHRQPPDHRALWHSLPAGLLLRQHRVGRDRREQRRRGAAVLHRPDRGWKARAERLARLTRRRRVGHRAVAECEALHRHHVRKPRRQRDRQVDDRERAGAVQAQRHGRRRPGRRLERCADHPRLAAPASGRRPDRDEGHLPLLPEGQGHDELPRRLPAGHRHRDLRRRPVHGEQRRQPRVHGHVHARSERARRRHRRRHDSSRAAFAARPEPFARRHRLRQGHARPDDRDRA